MYRFTAIGQSIANMNLVVAITWHELIYFWFGEQLNARVNIGTTYLMCVYSIPIL